MIFFKQQTLTLKEPTDSQILSAVFAKQRQKIEVVRNEILKIQQFIDVSAEYPLPVPLTMFLSTGAPRLS